MFFLKTELLFQEQRTQLRALKKKTRSLFLKIVIECYSDGFYMFFYYVSSLLYILLVFFHFFLRCVDMWLEDGGLRFLLPGHLIIMFR